MDLKTYQAGSMAEAMAAVKRDLGRDAVILHTRSFRKGSLFGFGGRVMWEITASKGVNVPSRRPRPLRPMQVKGGTAGKASRAASIDPAAAASAYSRKYVAGSPAASAPVASGGKKTRTRTHSSEVTVIRGPSHIPAVETNDNYIPQDNDQLSRQVEALTGMVEKLVSASSVNTRHGYASSRLGGKAGGSGVAGGGAGGAGAAGVAGVGPEELFETYVSLLQKDVSEEIADELVSRVRSQLTGDQLSDRRLVETKLKEFITSMIPTSITNIERSSGKARVIALIGPTGVGKTTTIAKLAANIKLRQGRRVGLITIDTYRIAAVEQLRTYAQIINVPLEVVMTPQELAAAIESMSHCDAILIDTAGRSPRDSERLVELKSFLAAAEPDETHLVLSATANPRNVEAAMERFGPLGVDRLILTKLDEAVSFGMILGVVRRLKASLSFVTTGQDVPDDIEITEGSRLAELILGGQL